MLFKQIIDRKKLRRVLTGLFFTISSWLAAHDHHWHHEHVHAGDPWYHHDHIYVYRNHAYPVYYHGHPYYYYHPSYYWAEPVPVTAPAVNINLQLGG